MYSYCVFAKFYFSQVVWNEWHEDFVGDMDSWPQLHQCTRSGTIARSFWTSCLGARLAFLSAVKFSKKTIFERSCAVNTGLENSIGPRSSSSSLMGHIKGMSSHLYLGLPLFSRVKSGPPEAMIWIYDDCTPEGMIWCTIILISALLVKHTIDTRLWYEYMMMRLSSPNDCLSVTAMK